MPKPARDRLARLLAGSEQTPVDSTALRLPGDTLTLEVAGVGPIRTPIRASEAKRLIGVARPAQFGHGEETLSDASVRDTWEVTSDQVRLGGPTWQAHLDAALDRIGDELGLPAGTRLTAELHSMLIYGNGQFFLPHQDSEKHDEMVASLVIMLPSVHTGGELIVDDGGHEKTYRGSRDDLVLVAFYADRRHEVRPVRSGYRATLTFNLLLTQQGTASLGGPVAEAVSYLREHFTTRVRSPYGGRDLGEPTRLAFLLDHEYTQKGLAAGRFKGADRDRVLTVRAAADQAACESVLALAEIKETWDVLADDGGWYHDCYGDEDAEVEPNTECEEYELNELIDEEIALGWWVDSGGTAQPIRLPLASHEVCAVTPTKSLTPYESEYEGYMGNYGNTLDRWYRRAAVVVWPKKDAFATRAEARPSWALQTLLERIDAGELDGARPDAASMEPFWIHLDSSLLAPALEVGARLRDATAARTVTAPFRLEMLTASHAPLLAALARGYGDPWVLDLFAEWASPRRLRGTDRLAWVIDSLVPLCQALREYDADELAAGCAELVWSGLWSRIDTSLNHAHPEQRWTQLAELAVPLARVLEAASADLAVTMADALLGSGDTVVELMGPTLRARESSPRPAVLALADDCRNRLTRIVEQPPRDETDWSIAWTGCGCDLCARLEAFLHDPTKRTDEWPMAKTGRQHVHGQIDTSGLPVRHITRRQGRPYTLVLTKTDDLFRREEDARRQARADLAWLTSAFE